MTAEEFADQLELLIARGRDGLSDEAIIAWLKAPAEALEEGPS